MLYLNKQKVELYVFWSLWDWEEKECVYSSRFNMYLTNSGFSGFSRDFSSQNAQFQFITDLDIRYFEHCGTWFLLLTSLLIVQLRHLNDSFLFSFLDPELTFWSNLFLTSWITWLLMN